MIRALTITFLAMATPAIAGPSIVGRWTEPDNKCTALGGEIFVGPKYIVADDWRCDFDSVQRVGDVVTWRGKCGFPEPAEPTTVIAESRGSSLMSLKLGRSLPTVYRRCPSK